MKMSIVSKYGSTFVMIIFIGLFFILPSCGGGGGVQGSGPEPPPPSIVGLSSINDTPTMDTLSANSALIDGNLTVSSGINIGQSLILGGDLRLRHVGLDFVNIVSLNSLYVYVDRQLPPTIANNQFFKWDVYTSQDNQTWTLYQSGLMTFFDSFENRFVLSFPTVTTRYIKASVGPLPITALPPPGFDIGNIYITEIKAFSRTTGTATIVSLNSASTGSNNCNNNPVDVVFNFIPANPANANDATDKNSVLTVGDSKNPPHNYVLSKGLTIGSTHPCIRQVEVRGTFSPVIFIFTDVDLSDYAASCF